MPGHFLPLLHVAGLAAAAHRPFDLLVDGFEHGSLSMAAYSLAP
jgi:4,5-DOPA dioxygenase extradiol